ncbi:hypothetical protein [Jannaschia donghaensis]|uniref:hypothetical protein n=1 Tax=Jannaschia donghaensis TaxID=420998 RepID=UPI000A50889D|nr:hypothetical protein [Jannaschia donghaensis]
MNDVSLTKAMVVLSPVFAGQFDATDLAECLTGFSYSGRYIAVVPICRIIR